jgi:ankyrin repeat protein
MSPSEGANSRKPPFLTLPNELLFEVASNLESFEDRNSLVRTSRFFRAMFNTDLYRRAVAADGIVLDKIVERVLSRYRLTSLTLLLDNGLSVNHSGHFAGYYYEDTMLRFLCGLDNQKRSVRLARLLIQRGTDIEAKCHLKETALYRAISYMNYPIAALLLAHGAEPNVASHLGETPLLCACGRGWGQAEMIHLLIAHGADIEARSAIGDTPLILSSVRKEKHGIMKALLELGADAGAHNECGETPLHYASCWLEGQHHELAKSLLEHGADVNATDRVGLTPLQWLLGSNSRDPLFMAKFLLENGADVNRVSRGGISPLHTACSNVRGLSTLLTYQYGDLLELLLEYGAIINAPDAGGRTALSYLLISFEGYANKGAITDLIGFQAKVLLAHGANLEVLTAEERGQLSRVMGVIDE